MKKITPFLWFEQEEAMKLPPFSRTHRWHVRADRMAGGIGRSREFWDERRTQIQEAISMYVDCEDQAEVDSLWNALTADGGEESQCGWLKDKFGLSGRSSQAVGELMGDPCRKMGGGCRRCSRCKRYCRRFAKKHTTRHS